MFATRFHVDLFKQVHGIEDEGRMLLAGWPMEYLPETLAPFANLPKRKLVLFPHRIAPEKQVEIFRDLATEFPDYEFRVCQETNLTKQQYHELLGQAVAVFSASNQETLGIGLYEGLLCGAMPIAPDRLSYSEMYPAECLYPSAWTTDQGSYQRCKSQLVTHMRSLLAQATGNQWESRANELKSEVGGKFFDGSRLYEALVS